MMDETTRRFGKDVFRRFLELPVESDGSVWIPPGLYRDMIDVALDVLAGPDSKMKRGAPAMLQMLVRLPVERRRTETWLRRQLEGLGKEGA